MKIASQAEQVLYLALLDQRPYWPYGLYCCIGSFRGRSTVMGA
jgi:hypothetical protein